MMFKKLCLIGSMLASANASATFTIAAYDPGDGKFGAAFATCFPLRNEYANFNLAEKVVAIIEGKGIVVTQGEVEPLNNINLDHAKLMIERGNTARQILNWLRNNDQARIPSQRQYLIVLPNVRGRASTGFSLERVRGSISGLNVVTAGNDLDSGVLEALYTGFQNDKGNLKSKLMAALVNVKNSGIGDKRCTGPHGVSSHTASVTVGSYSKFYNSPSDTKDAIEGLVESLEPTIPLR